MHYPEYPVPHYSSFEMLLKDACVKYNNLILFETMRNIVTYAQFAKQVAVGLKELTGYKNQYILINVAKTNLFAVAFFVVIISGNIACLSHNSADKTGTPFEKVDIRKTIDEKTVLDWLAEEQSENYESNLLNDCSVSDCMCEPDRLAVVLCSSGTTAVPKGICLSQRNLCSCTEAGIKILLYPEKCRYVSILPMHHAFGIVADLLGAIYTGGTLCLPDTPYQLYASLRIFKPEAMHVPPAAAERLAELLKTSSDPKALTGGMLNKIMCAGAPLHQKTITELRSHSILTLAAYGLTECSPCVSMNRDEDYKDGSCGLILSNNKVRISSEGEILVCGDGVMLGYLNDPESTAETIKEGWLHTGDLGYFDEDGFLYVTGRLNNLIVFSDGSKLAPEALEEKLTAWEEISECVVWSEDNSLCIQACVNSDTVDKKYWKQLELRIKEFVMAETKHIVLYTQVSDMPIDRNENGKVIRKGAISCIGKSL